MSTTIPEKCPKCGSNVRASIPDVGIQFECAAIALESGHFSEALPCVMRQRDQLAKRVRVLEKERSWRPIQTCPHNREWVLGYDENDGETGMIIYDWEPIGGFSDGCNRLWTDGMRTWTPTHWMPLPEPPKEKGAQ